MQSFMLAHTGSYGEVIVRTHTHTHKHIKNLRFLYRQISKNKIIFFGHKIVIIIVILMLTVINPVTLQSNLVSFYLFGQTNSLESSSIKAMQ